MTGKPKVLITGGFGNLGSWLSEHFYQSGYEVTILSKSTRKLKNIRYQVIQADISDYKELDSKLKGSFDYCIHTASYNEFFHDNYAKKALLINSLGTRNLVDILSQTNIKKFIYFSTFHVYGNQHTDINEQSELSPCNDYASTHLFAEYYLKQFYNTNSFPSIICRLTNSYGAPKSIDSSKWYLVLNDLVLSAYNKQCIKLSSNGEASRDFVWMGDVCNITEALLKTGIQTGVYNISSGQNYKVIELANIVKKVYQNRYRKEIDILVNAEDINQYRITKVSNQKLLKVIDYQFLNKLEEEVINIFSLLDQQNA